VTERKDIGARLENWGRWAREVARGGISPTGVYCERMRKAAMGDLAGGSDRQRVDDADAELIEAAVLRLLDGHRKMLKLCYVDQSPPEYVARKCGFRVREFVERFRHAQFEVERVLREERFHDAA
jgi:DNA-directed RNA polymerase specialized sigma24 family protein